MTSFSEWEIELFCPTCDVDFVVLGKQLVQSSELPCPACNAPVRVDVWSFHAQWARVAKSLGWR